ncbi:hypothetical protein KYB31_17730 [Clostridium felsineum]|nr:hypothetical protein [Clostridium felsineum]
MIILFVLIFLGIGIYFIVDLMNKEEKQKRHIMVLTRQNNKLKKVIKEYENKNKGNYKEEIIIKYMPVKSKSGVVNKKSVLYIAPIHDSQILGDIQSGSNIKIIDSGKIQNELWYEVILDLNRDTNNKGWIPSSDLILDEDIIEPK